MKLKQTGVTTLDIYLTILGGDIFSAHVSVFERMTYKIYPHPPNYFVTLSKLKESRFFSYHPPTFSDNVTLYDGVFLRASLRQTCDDHPYDLSRSYNDIRRRTTSPNSTVIFAQIWREGGGDQKWLNTKIPNTHHFNES